MFVPKENRVYLFFFLSPILLNPNGRRVVIGKKLHVNFYEISALSRRKISVCKIFLHNNLARIFNFKSIFTTSFIVGAASSALFPPHPPSKFQLLINFGVSLKFIYNLGWVKMCGGRVERRTDGLTVGEMEER